MAVKWPSNEASPARNGATLSIKVASFAASAALIVGCVAKNTTPIDSGIESSVLVGSAGGSIKARAGFIEDQADRIINVSIGTPETPIVTVKPQVESIRAEAANIKIDQRHADESNVAERKAWRDEIKSLQSEISDRGITILDLKIERARLESRWYVRIGKYIDGWIKFAAIALPIAWIGSGILAIFLPTWLPTTGLVWSKAIVRFMPFMNWASWIRDRRAKK